MIKIEVIRRPSAFRRGWAIALMHADRDGGPVLVEDASWRTINGVLLTTHSRHLVCLFRRIAP
jgi:hypothetical protein